MSLSLNFGFNYYQQSSNFNLGISNLSSGSDFNFGVGTSFQYGMGTPGDAFMSALSVLDGGMSNYDPYGLGFSGNQYDFNSQYGMPGNQYNFNSPFASPGNNYGSAAQAYAGPEGAFAAATNGNQSAFAISTPYGQQSFGIQNNGQYQPANQLQANQMLGAQMQEIGRDLQDDGIVNGSHRQQQQQLNPMQQMMMNFMQMMQQMMQQQQQQQQQQQMNPMQQMMQFFMQMMMMMMQMMMQMMGMNPQQNQYGQQSPYGQQQAYSPYGNNGASASASAGPYGSSAAASAGNSSAAASSTPYGNNGSNPNAINYQPQGSTAMGRNLASVAERTANNMHSTGWCYRGVARSLAQVGVNVSGGSAYMAADQLARNNKFQEANVPRNDLKNLPAGAVVVWDKCPGHPHGHISVALGDGREASDHIQNQMTNYGPRYRVFLPK